MDLSKLSDSQLLQLIQNRWNESSSLWEVVSNSYNKNIRVWENNPEWLDNLSPKRSHARDNRTFLAMESVIKTLTGRPSKPNVLSTESSPDGKQIASDLQDFFLAKYRDLGLKAKMRRSLRWLFLSRLLCLKVFWNNETDDFDIGVMDPRRIRFSKKSTSMYDTTFAIEEIPEKPIAELLIDFPEKKKAILLKTGQNEEQILVNNPTVIIKEFWMGDYVCWSMNDLILDRQDHPYWDFDGVPMTPGEMAGFKDMPGKQRRLEGRRLKKESKGRRASDKRYKSYLYNYFDKPLPPYIFGTVLNIENQPVGQTSLIEQVVPLQEEIDKRKRQISDNADMVNGIFKVDTNLCQITETEAQQAKADPKGIWYGKGVLNGITREVGTPLPATVHQDMVHSTVDLDNIFGTGNTFRGEQGPKETATGRAILREESYKYLDEFIDLMDTTHHQIYSWMYQMMKVKYTEKHYIKPIGAAKGQRVIELTQDDLADGLEIQVFPGQVMPDDRMYRSERAKEEAVAGLIDPLTYFEETERDNAMELAKRLVMFKMNPLSILDLTEEDMAKLQGAGQIMSPDGQPAQGGPLDPRAQQMAELKQKAEQIAQSPEFQNLPPEEQQKAMQLIAIQMKKLQMSAATPPEQKPNKPKK